MALGAGAEHVQGDGLRLRGEIRDHVVEALAAAAGGSEQQPDVLRAQILQVTAQVKEAYFNTILAQRLIEVSENALERDRALLENAGANATEHVIGRPLLDNDVVDAGALQQLSKQQPGGAGADDGDHCLHGW